MIRFLYLCLLGAGFFHWSVLAQSSLVTLSEVNAQLAALGHTPREDSARVDLLVKKAVFYRQISIDSSRMIALEATQLAQQTGYQLGYARAMTELGNRYTDQGNKKEAIICYKNSLSIFQQNAQPEEEAKCYANIGILSQDIKQYDSAAIFFNQAASILKPIDSMHKFLGTIYYNLAVNYLQQSIYSENILKFLEKSFAIAEKNEDTNLIVSIYLAYGKHYRLNGNASEQHQVPGYMLKALHLAKRTDNKLGIFRAYSAVVGYYMQNENYPKSLSYVLEMEEIFKNMGKHKYLYFLYKTKGVICLNLEEPENAYVAYQLSLKNANTADDSLASREQMLVALNAWQKTAQSPELERLLQEKGDLQIALTDYENAIETYKKLLNLYKKETFPNYFKAVYENLARAYDALGDPHSAKKYRAKAAVCCG